jgi:hypothetical protein
MSTLTEQAQILFMEVAAILRDHRPVQQRGGGYLESSDA